MYVLHKEKWMKKNWIVLLLMLMVFTGCNKYEFDGFDPVTSTVKWMTKQKKDNDKKTND
jgi:hypothetical protein